LIIAKSGAKTMIMIDEWNYQDLLSCLEQNKQFTFTRFGDGEWNAIFRKEGVNCDKHTYFKDMGDALAEVLISSPNYRLGMQNMATRVQGAPINGFLDLNELKIAWCNADMLHKASIKNNIEPFFKALSQRNTVMIGPAYLKSIDKIVKYKHFIEIFPVNCWEQKDYIIEECRKIKLDHPVFSNTFNGNEAIVDAFNHAARHTAGSANAVSLLTTCPLAVGRPKRFVSQTAGLASDVLGFSALCLKKGTNNNRSCREFIYFFLLKNSIHKANIRKIK